MADFVARLGAINTLADDSPGFVWRLQDGSGDSTAMRPFGSDEIIVNMSVWESADALFQYTYKSDHASVFRRRKEWFEVPTEPHLVLWWVPRGHIPGMAEGEEKLTHLRGHGPSEAAFTLKKRFPPARAQAPQYDPKVQPPYRFGRLRAAVARAPERPLYPLERTLCELTGPVFSQDDVADGENDLTRTGAGPPIGEVITVWGQVMDEESRPVPNTLVEIWQGNAAGRYDHAADQSDRVLDPNFHGAGRTVTNETGHYRFRTIRPAPYPGGGAADWWRPAHIHFSLIGPSFMSRVVTQMYFPGDPLIGADRIIAAIPDEAARQRLISRLDPPAAEGEPILSYTFDLVLRGRHETPLESQPR